MDYVSLSCSVSSLPHFLLLLFLTISLPLIQIYASVLKLLRKVEKQGNLIESEREQHMTETFKSPCDLSLSDTIDHV